MWKLLFLSFSLYALEVDSKLTLRIQKVSDSQKTILINRGIEDGLAKNDHAKFFVSTGVVARGVVLKVSPTRSVWSLYRLIDTSKIRPEEVMKLKVTEPVKITKDESKTLVEDDTPTVLSTDPRDLGIPLAENADDLTELEKARIEESGKMAMAATTVTKPFEIGLEGALNAVSSSVASSSDTTDGQDTHYHLRFFGEYYLMGSNFLEKLSLSGQYAVASQQSTSFDGSQTSESFSEFGFGSSFHFITPNEVAALTPYVNADFSVGSVTSQYKPGQNSAAAQTEVSGSTVALSLGLGVKYLSSFGLSFRFNLAYLYRNIAYEAAQVGAATFDKTQNGLKFYGGLGFRF